MADAASSLGCSASPAATYEEFLRLELESLGLRLLQKHQSFLGSGVSAPVHEAEPWSNADKRWVRLTCKLLDKDDAEAAEGDLDADELAIAVEKQKSLELRAAWHFSWADAKRRGRKRLAGPKPTRFNETVADDSFLQRFVVGPDSQIQFLWAFFATMFIVWDTITLPLELFPMKEEFDAVLFIVMLLSLAFWLIDMPLKVLFGVQFHGAIEMRPDQLWRIYVRSWLPVDVVVVLVDLVLLTLEWFSSVDPLLRSGRLLRTLRLVRLVRLLRLGKLESQVMKIAHRLLSTYSLMALRVAGYLALMVAMNHLIACCWYAVGSYTEDQGNWLQRSAVNPDSVSDAYVASLHWSLTQFTPSTNAIGPNNSWERFYAIWVILLAMACFSSFIGSIGNTVTSMRMVRQKQRLQHSKLEVFFSERNLSLDLFDRVKAALRQDLSLARLREEEVELITGIPDSIRTQLHKEMYYSALRSVDIWPGWSHEEDADFFRSLCHHAMSEHMSRAGQDIFTPRTPAHSVYVLQTGSLDYFSANGDLLASCTADSVSKSSAISLPSLWVEWNHVGLLTTPVGLCCYVGIDCSQFCTLAARFGGPLCEYLKVLGLLLLAEIEAREASGRAVTDISVRSDIDVRSLAQRAERFTSLKENGLYRSGSRISDAGLAMHKPPDFKFVSI